MEEFKTKLRYGALPAKIIKFLQGRAFFPYFYKILYILRLEEFSRASLEPSAIAKSKAFFGENKARISKVCASLADDKSRLVLERQISFRSTGKPLPLGTTADRYFPKDIISLTDREFFVDCGAYDGDSVKRFLRACNYKYKGIAAFEPSPESFAALKANNFKNCVCFECGLWDKEDILPFAASRRETAKLLCAEVQRFKREEEATAQITLRVLDNIPACAEATYIKMDIEGAELNALKGAEKIIRGNKPILAVSIYHSDGDLLEIPLWIMSLGLDYNYYIRHHGVAFAEVIFYAVPRGSRALSA